MSLLSCPQEERRGAHLSPDRKYRYKLWREWGPGPKVMWIGLNPSTADENMDDPTIRRMIGFSKAWGYDGLFTCNLFGLISPYPEHLLTANDPVGGNNLHLIDTAPKAGLIVLCWGSFPEAKERAAEVLELLKDYELHCLGTNQDGSPRHPLYLPKDTKLDFYAPPSK